MTEKKPTDQEIAFLTLQHLQEFRNEFRDFRKDIRGDLTDIKFRLQQVEETLLHHNRQFDRMGERLTRIENRLELAEV